MGGLSLALLAAFVARQATVATPLLPLRMFRSRNVSGANVVQILMVAGLFGNFFLGVLYMQRVLGYDPIETGLAFLPVSLGIGTLSLGFSARLDERFGARAVLLVGLGLVAAALALLARAPVDGGYVVDLLPSMVLLGVGAGVAFPATMTLAMSGATSEDAGLASGLVNTTQQVGAALGLAVLATLATTHSETLAGRGEGSASALAGGYGFGFAVAAGLVLVGLALGAAVLQSERVAAAEVADITPERRELREAA